MVELKHDLWWTYVAECTEVGVEATISDFMIWLEENGEEAYE